jgi:hypothetical protein
MFHVEHFSGLTCVGMLGNASNVPRGTLLWKAGSSTPLTG